MSDSELTLARITEKLSQELSRGRIRPSNILFQEDAFWRLHESIYETLGERLSGVYMPEELFGMKIFLSKDVPPSTIIFMDKPGSVR